MLLKDWNAKFMDSKKVKVGSVSYLNAKPLIYGFEKGMMKADIELVTDYPSAIASQLIEDKIDIGLVPIAVIPLLKEYYIVSDYCIGSDGEVASVCLFSDVPIEEIKTVLLDYQSRTSVALLKILLREHWKIDPVLVSSAAGYEHDIKGSTAGLVIGDRALEQRKRSEYKYDLGLAWKEMTGLPFVFAAWVSNKKLPVGFCTAFNEANKAGLDQLKMVVAENPYDLFDLEQYYTDFIKFRLDLKMREAIALFLKKLNDN